MRAAAVGLIAVLIAVPARAERLPLRAYGTTEGLPSTAVLRIRADSRGLLWFATRDGLARFDGTRFTVYGVDQGLPVPTVNDVIEARQGGYWIATNGGGVCWLDPAAPLSPSEGTTTKLFRCDRVGDDALSSSVNVVLEDRSGVLWAGADSGLFRRERDQPFVRVDVGLRPPRLPDVNALVEDASGGVWIGTHSGLFRAAAGAVRRVPLPPGRERVNALTLDRRGHVWAGLARGIVRVEPSAWPPAVVDVSAGLSDPRVNRMHETRDGQLWAGTAVGLARLEGGTWIDYVHRHGLARDAVTALSDDRDGNLWIGTYGALMKLQRDGLVGYDDPDATANESVWSLYEGDAGEVFAVSGDWRVSRFDGKQFVSARLRPPAPEPDYLAQAAFRDRTGGWWVLSTAGLGRYPPGASLNQLAGRGPARTYTRADGLPGDRIYRVFEDARGDLWIGGELPPGTAGLARWERATGRIHPLPTVRAQPGDMPNAINEDGRGAIWVGFIRGGLGRLRDGTFTLFTPAQGAPKGMVTSIHRDRHGRLWIGTNQDGLTRVDDPAADQPRFVRIGTAQGLATNNIRCITSDAAGRIYAGTVRGVDRFDPDTGTVRHYTTADGLPAAFVLSALRDGRGDLWFGTRSGLARLTPAASPSAAAPPDVWIGGLRVGGVAAPISHLGERTLSPIRIAPDRNQLQIEFFVVDPAGGDVRFQYGLADEDEWSAPTGERTVHFSRLAHGRHLFRVRALSADGTAGAPASVELIVLPTLWQRGSVRFAIVALVALALYGAHRFRVGHLVAVERVRARIASDLHDDIGNNLSQIAIVSEVARQQPAARDAAVADSLEQIASLSRASVDSMGDIVWATNPGRDSLRDLSQRMRQHATEILGARGIAFTFQGLAEDVNGSVDGGVRREVFLVFKEAISNLARHSGCMSARIELTRQHGDVLVRVADDGKGLTEADRSDGHGMTSMVRRARALGGELEIGAGPAGGTVVTLRAPLKPARARSYTRA